MFLKGLLCGTGLYFDYGQFCFDKLQMCRWINWVIHWQIDGVDQFTDWLSTGMSMTDSKIIWIYCFVFPAPPRWLSSERVGLMTWWLWVRSPVETNFLSGVFSYLTSAEKCEKSSRWLWIKSCVSTCVRKPGNTLAWPTAIIMIWP